MFDTLVFIGSPLIALGIALALPHLPFLLAREEIFGTERRWASFLVGIWTFSHLWAVIFRSHFNPVIFRQFPWRFTAVPAGLFVLMAVSKSLLVVGIVIVFYWDVYHTSKQNFGFCRIYDAMRGNPPGQGRGLDIALNHLLYIGPLLAGVNYLSHVRGGLRSFLLFGDQIQPVIVFLESIAPSLQIAFLTLGPIFVLYYITRYFLWSREGYSVSPQKVVLLASTTLASIWGWCFLPPLQALILANLYHGLQYFGIVWIKEKQNIGRAFRLPETGLGNLLGLTLFVVLLFVLGLAQMVSSGQNVQVALSLFTVVSLMHFWYDGFIWSVRKGAI